jgi:O-antigen ligase
VYGYLGDSWIGYFRSPCVPGISMTKSLPLSASSRISAFWQHHGGLSFFGPVVMLLGFLGLSTAGQRWIIYLVLGAFVLTQARWIFPVILRHSVTFQISCIFILYSLLSLLWQDSFEGAEAIRSVRTGVVIFLFLAFFGWATLVADCRNQAVVRAVQIFCFAAVLVAVIAVILYMYDSVSVDRRLGVSGMTKNPVKAATVFSVVLITFMVWRSRFSDLVGWRGLALFILPIIVLVLLTFSRGPLIGVALTATLGLVLAEQKKIAAVLICFILLLALLIFSGGFDHFEIIKRADSHRFEIWADAFEKITQKPIFGWGIKDLTKFAASSGAPGWKSPHNVFVGTLFYGGFVGLGLFVLMIVMSYKTAIRLCKKNDIAQLALMLLTFGLIIGCFNARSVMVNTQSEWLTFWLPIGLLVGLELKNKGIKLEGD